MDEHARHAQRVGHETGVLSACAAETAQRVLGDVVAALHRDVLDRVGHVLDRDAQETVGDLLGRARLPLRRGNLRRERRKLRPDHVGIQRGVAVGAEHLGKEFRIELAHHHIAVGHRQRSAAAIGGRPGCGARRFGSDAEARAVERADRTAAGGDGVDAHHRRAQAHAGDFGHERAFILAGPVRDVGGRAAHVETDDPIEARLPRDLDRADDATRRSGQDGVLALEEIRIGQAAARLHELQADAGIVATAGELALDVPDVAAQDRRQVRIDHRGVAARHQLHQRAHFMRHRDLREADRASARRQRLLVLRITIAVHQHDRHRADAVVPGRAQARLGAGQVERHHHVAMRADALVDLDHAVVEHRRQLDPAYEELRAVLVRDAQRVGETAGDQQRRALPLALEQRVGRDRRAHLHRVDDAGRNGRAGCQLQQFADTLHRGVGIALGVLGQELRRHQRAVGLARDDVRERPAAVDPELPLPGCRHAGP